MCAADETLGSAKKELQASILAMNTEHNLVVIQPSGRVARNELNDVDALREAQLELPESIQLELAAAHLPMPPRPCFYVGSIHGDALNKGLYDKMFRSVLRGVKRSSMMAVRQSFIQYSTDICYDNVHTVLDVRYRHVAKGCSMCQKLDSQHPPQQHTHHSITAAK